MGSRRTPFVPAVAGTFAMLLAAGVQAQGVERVSVATGGGQGNSQSRYPTVSDGGRYIAFESDASNLVADDSNG